jgi:hypothetical protein
MEKYLNVEEKHASQLHVRYNKKPWMFQYYMYLHEETNRDT